MTAFRRRTVFAAPLIVIAGCGGKDAPKDPPRPPRIPGESWSVYMTNGHCRAGVRMDCPEGVACNPPAPIDIECPAGITETSNVVVVKKPDATCGIVPDGCTALACATQATPCPVPEGIEPAGSAKPTSAPKLTGPAWSITRDNHSKTACLAFDARACSVPAGQPTPPCNPPPPQPVTCPAALGDQPWIQAAQLPDGRCAIVAASCTDLSCVKESDVIECPHPYGQK